MSGAPASTAAFATRRRAVNCAEDCRSALSGARPMARSASTPTRPSSPPSALFSRALARRARRVASGYGFVPKGSHSLCRCIRARRSAGSRPATPPSTTFSQIPPMPAPTLMANHVGRRCWMHRASAESGSGLAPGEREKLAATVAAAERLEADRETSLRQWRLGVERASYEASRAERRYRAVDPDNRLVARGLEREWEGRLSALESAKAELSRREEARPRALSQDERSRLFPLVADLATVSHAATTTPPHRKELLRTLLEEVIVKVERDKATARLTLRWHGSALAEIDLALPRSRPATIRTDEA